MKKNFKVLLSILTLIFSFSIFTSLMSNQNSNINKVYAVEEKGFQQISVTEYHIYDETGYKAFVDFANSEGTTGITFKLMNNISLNNNNGYVINEFNGTFYGGFKRITGLPMFCKVNNEVGTIQNVEIASSINNNKYYGTVLSDDRLHTWYGAGVIAGINYGIISYCGVIDAEITLQNTYCAVGGIVGINMANDIEDCYVYNSILTATGKESCSGGLCGYLAGVDSSIVGCISANNTMVAEGFEALRYEMRGAGLDISGEFGTGGLFGMIVYPWWVYRLDLYISTKGAMVTHCYSKPSELTSGYVDSDYIDIGGFVNQAELIGDSNFDEESAGVLTIKHIYGHNPITNIDSSKSVSFGFAYVVVSSFYGGQYFPQLISTYETIIATSWFDAEAVMNTTEGTAPHDKEFWTTDNGSQTMTIIMKDSVSGSGTPEEITESIIYEPVITGDLSYWTFPINTDDDYGGYPHFKTEPTVLEIKYYANESDYKNGYLSSIYCEFDKNDPKNSIKIDTSPLLNVVNAYDNDNELRVLKGYYYSETATTGFINYTYNGTGLTLSVNTNLMGDSNTTKYTIVPSYQDIINPRINILYNYVSGTPSGQEPTITFVDDSGVNNTLSYKSGTSIVKTLSYKMGELATPKNYSFTVQDKGEEYVYYIYATFTPTKNVKYLNVSAIDSVNREVPTGNSVNSVIPQDINYLNGHLGSYEFNWSAETLPGTYNSGNHPIINLYLFVFREFDMVAYMEEGSTEKYPFKVLEGAPVMYIREIDKFKNIDRNPFGFKTGGVCEGYSYKGDVDYPCLDKDMYPQHEIPNVLFDDYDCFIGYTTFKSTDPYRVVAVWSTAVGTKTYRINYETLGNTLGSNTNIYAELTNVKIYYDVGGETYFMYLVVNDSKLELSDSSVNSMFEFDSYIDIVVTYPDQESTSANTTVSIVTGSGNIEPLDITTTGFTYIEYNLYLGVENAYDNCKYMLYESESEGFDKKSFDTAKIWEYNSEGGYDYTYNSSSTIKWDGKTDGQQYFKGAELITVTLNNESVKNTDGEMYAINGSEIYSEPTNIPSNITGYYKDDTFKEEELVFATENSKITDIYTVNDCYDGSGFSFVKPQVTLYGKSEVFDLYYYETETVSITYQANDDWTYNALGYYYSKEQSFIPQLGRVLNSSGNYKFKGWHLTSEPVTDQKELTDVMIEATEGLNDNTSYVYFASLKEYANEDNEVYIYEVWVTDETIEADVVLKFYADVYKRGTKNQDYVADGYHIFEVGYSTKNGYNPVITNLTIPTYSGYNFDEFKIVPTGGLGTIGADWFFNSDGSLKNDVNSAYFNQFLQLQNNGTTINGSTHYAVDYIDLYYTEEGDVFDSYIDLYVFYVDEDEFLAKKDTYYQDAMSNFVYSQYYSQKTWAPYGYNGWTNKGVFTTNGTVIGGESNPIGLLGIQLFEEAVSSKGATFNITKCNQQFEDYKIATKMYYANSETDYINGKKCSEIAINGNTITFSSIKFGGWIPNAIIVTLQKNQLKINFTYHTDSGAQLKEPDSMIVTEPGTYYIDENFPKDEYNGVHYLTDSNGVRYQIDSWTSNDVPAYKKTFLGYYSIISGDISMVSQNPPHDRYPVHTYIGGNSVNILCIKWREDPRLSTTYSYHQNMEMNIDVIFTQMPYNLDLTLKFFDNSTGYLCGSKVVTLNAGDSIKIPNDLSGTFYDYGKFVRAEKPSAYVGDLYYTLEYDSKEELVYPSGDEENPYYETIYWYILTVYGNIDSWDLKSEIWIYVYQESDWEYNYHQMQVNVGSQIGEDVDSRQILESIELVYTSTNDGMSPDEDVWDKTTIEVPTIPGAEYAFSHWVIVGSPNGYKYPVENTEKLIFIDSSNADGKPFSISYISKSDLLANMDSWGFMGDVIVDVYAVYTISSITVTIETMKDSKDLDYVFEEKTQYTLYWREGSASGKELYFGSTIDLKSYDDYSLVNITGLDNINEVIIQQGNQLKVTSDDSISPPLTIDIVLYYSIDTCVIEVEYLDKDGNSLKDRNGEAITADAEGVNLQDWYYFNYKTGTQTNLLYLTYNQALPKPNIADHKFIESVVTSNTATSYTNFVTSDNSKIVSSVDSNLNGKYSITLYLYYAYAKADIALFIGTEQYDDKGSMDLITTPVGNYIFYYTDATIRDISNNILDYGFDLSTLINYNSTDTTKPIYEFVGWGISATGHNNWRTYMFSETISSDYNGKGSYDHTKKSLKLFNGSQSNIESLLEGDYYNITITCYINLTDDECNVVVNYLDTSGNTIKDSETLVIANWEKNDGPQWGDSIYAPEIDGYTFKQWELLTGKDYFSTEFDANGVYADYTYVGIVESYPVDKHGRGRAELNVVYDTNKEACSVQIRMYAHPDSIDEQYTYNDSTAISFYHNTWAGPSYHLGQELSPDDLKPNFVGGKTYVFDSWKTYSGGQYYTISADKKTLTFSNTAYDAIGSNIIIEAHYIYAGDNTALFNIYYKIVDGQTTSGETELASKTYKFANPSLGDLDHGEEIPISVSGAKFLRWETPIIVSGNDDYASLFNFSESRITTADAPSVTGDNYVIKLVALLEINKVDITINYTNSKTNTNIQTASYVLFYNDGMKHSSESEVLQAQSVIPVLELEDYRFTGWEVGQDTQNVYENFFNLSSNELKVVDGLTGIDAEGQYSLTFTANYWPQDLCTIEILTQFDDEEPSLENTYYYYYTGPVPEGDNNIGVGEVIFADSYTGNVSGVSFGYSFLEWYLDSTAQEFLTASGTSIMTKTPSVTGKHEIKAIAKYQANLAEITVIHNYPTATSTEDNIVYEQGEELKYTFYYDSTSKLVVKEDSYCQYNDTKNAYQFFCIEAYNGNKYVFSRWDISSNTFLLVEGDNLFTQVVGNPAGKHEVTINAYYELNIATFRIKTRVGADEGEFVTIEGEHPFSLNQDNKYVYQYRNSLADYTFAVPNINTDKVTYEFSHWLISLETGNSQYTYLFNTTKIDTKITELKTKFGTKEAYGIYDVIITACYESTENICFISVSYISGDEDISNVEVRSQTEYKFYYDTLHADCEEGYVGLGYQIVAPEKNGYTFKNWIISGDIFFEEYESGNTITLVTSQPVDPTNTAKYVTGNQSASLTAVYEENVCKITVEYLDLDGKKLPEGENKTYLYYYLGSHKADGMVYNESEESANVIRVQNFAGYNFIKWVLTEGGDYLNISADNKTLSIKQKTDTTGIQYATVQAYYKSHADYYITVKVDQVHWEEEYYKGNTTTLNSNELRYYYHVNSPTGLTASTNEGYNFRNWKEVEGVDVVTGLKSTDLYTLGGATNLYFIDKTKIDGVLIADMTYDSVVSQESVYTEFTYVQPTAYFTLLDEAIGENGNLEISLVAYYSKQIDIKTDEIEDDTSKEINAPVNYVIDNSNFADLVSNNDLKYEYTRPATIKYSYFYDMVLKSLPLTVVDRLPTSRGANRDFAVEDFEINVGTILTSSSVVDDNGYPSVYNLINTSSGEALLASYTPNYYTYSGWGLTIPTKTSYSVGNVSNLTLNDLDNSLKTYIQGITYDSSTWDDNNSINIYIQWKGDGYTITFDTPIKIDYANYNSQAGEEYQIIYDFAGTIKNDSKFWAELNAKIGLGEVQGVHDGYQYNYKWKIKELEDGTVIYDAEGDPLQVGDEINYIYSNSHGNFTIEPVYELSPLLTVKLNYHTSNTILSTTGAQIYDNTTIADYSNIAGNDIVYIVNDKHVYNEAFRFGDILKDDYKDPNPLKVVYNGVTYYLAGWSFVETDFNPSDWYLGNANETLYSSLANFDDEYIYFVRNNMNFSGMDIYLEGLPGLYDREGKITVLSYDGDGFINAYGNAYSEINLHAVWLPYYDINIYSVPPANSDESADANIYNGQDIVYSGQTEKKAEGGKVTLNYGITLQEQNINLYYDIYTSLGQTPNKNIKGYNLARLHYILQGYTITDGSLYYRLWGAGYSWVGSRENYYNFTNTTNYSYISLSSIFSQYLETKSIDSSMSIDVYPYWKEAEIKVTATNMEGESESIDTTIKLVGIYKISAKSIAYHSVDYALTDSNKTIKYLNGTNFKYSDVLTDIKRVNTSETIVGRDYDRHQLTLNLSVYYAGDLYFLRIQSQDAVDKLPYDDNSIQCANAIVLTDLPTYISKELTTSEEKASELTLNSLPAYISKVTAIGTANRFNDYTEIYEYCLNKVISYNGNFYLCLAYGDNVYDEDKNVKLTGLEKGDGSLLEYYLYNSQYAYDMLPLSQARDNSFSIRFDNKGDRYFNGDGEATTPTTWIYENKNTISAVWKSKNYHLDLSVGLLDGNISYSNSGYLVVEVLYQDSKLNVYYVLNYELVDNGSMNEFKLYTLNKTQYESFNRYYNGWDSLGLTPKSSSRVTVMSGANVNIYAYDQSLDISGDSLIGYRLERVDIKNPTESNSTECEVNKTNTISFNGVEYIETNGYITKMDFLSVDMENNSVITFQAVMGYINYSLTVKTDIEDAGVIAGSTDAGNFSSNEYTYSNLILNKDVNVSFRPNIGYELANWSLNTNNVGTNYSYFTEIDVNFLREYVYKGLNNYSVEENQNIGELVAIHALIEFELRVNIVDHENLNIESYVLPTTPQDKAIVEIERQARAGGAIDLNKLTLSQQTYIINVLPKANNGYLCYSYDSVDYAILGMFIKGGSREYGNKTYVFPTNSFESMEFVLNSAMLADLVSFTPGVVVSPANRVIDMYVNVARIYEIKADTNEALSAIQTIGDLHKGTRKLIASETIIASADEGYAISPTSNAWYAYYGQSVLLHLDALTEFYSGGKIYVLENGEYIENSVAIGEEIEIVVTDNTLVKANFEVLTLDYTLEVSYQGAHYTLSNYTELTNISDKPILKIFPTATITDANGNPRINAFYYGDILQFSFNKSNFMDNILTDGELKDYYYKVIVNGELKDLQEKDYTFNFEGNLSIIIEIVPSTGNEVSIYANITTASEIIAVTKQGATKNITTGTVVFNLISGDGITIYMKNNIGYNFVGYSYKTNSYSVILADGELDYQGYKKFTLISEYNSNLAGVYVLEFEYINILPEFKYFLHDEECVEAGTGYYTINPSNGTTIYNITDKMQISKPLVGGENPGFRFIGFSIGGNVEEIELLNDGSDQAVINLEDYLELLRDNNYVLPIYVNFIRQHLITIEAFENTDYNQTNIEVKNDLGDSVLKATNSRDLPKSTRYMDESIYSERSYTLTVQSKDTTNYYLQLQINGETIEAGDDNYTYQIINGTNLVYEGVYTFELDKDYSIKVTYLPRQYAKQANIYVIKDVETLDKYNEDPSTELEKLTNPSTPVELTITSDTVGFDDCYGSTNTIELKISEAYNSDKEVYYADYVMYMIKINGRIQELKLEETIENGARVYKYTCNYQVQGQVDIEVILKQVYGVDTEVIRQEN